VRCDYASLRENIYSTGTLPAHYLLDNYIFVLNKMFQGAEMIVYRFMKKKRNEAEPSELFQIKKPEIDEQAIKKSWNSIVQKINQQPKKKRQE
jgi:uncharacterized membrane-anchored protein YjiN (DUF445 family)